MTNKIHTHKVLTKLKRGNELYTYYGVISKFTHFARIVVRNLIRYAVKKVF